MTTIMDVARKAGVSKSTVSKAVNGKGRISEATKRIIFKAIEELNYRPNIIAQTLTRPLSDTLGLIIPGGYTSSEYIIRIIDLSRELAEKQGKSLIITYIDGFSISSAIKAITYLVDMRCDGILLYKTSHIEPSSAVSDLIALIEQIKPPVIVLNYKLPGLARNCVLLDNFSSSQLVLDHLIERGHRRIAYISGTLGSQTSISRREGYFSALRKNGIAIDDSIIFSGNASYESGYNAAMQLFQDGLKITAIVCYNDRTAIGVLNALNNMKIDVPERISLVGFDNEDITNFLSPGVSSVLMPVDEMVKQAFGLLSQHFTGVLEPLRQQTLCGQLIMRNSVCYVPDPTTISDC